LQKNIPYGRQEITEEDIQAVVGVLKSDFLTQGPAVEAFEKSVSDFLGVKFASAVSNGTTALHLAAAALNVKPGTRVIVPAITFAASANCIRYCGGDVVFCDVDLNTGCLDLSHVEKIFLESKSENPISGVVAVDFSGHPVAMDRLRKICDRFGAWIIEDACHALGAAFQDEKGRRHMCGNGELADITVFSFHPVKHIATGEGGMVVTNNSQLNSRIRLLRTHGITRNPSEFQRQDGNWYYEMQELGFNYRMPDILCVLGSSQMKRISQNLNRRREIAKTYFESLSGVGDLILPPQNSPEHAYHLFVVRTQKRLELYNFLREAGVFCQVHYIPVYKFPYYKNLYGNMELHNAEKFYSTCLSLPMFHSLKVEDQDYTIRKIKEFFS
jgi:UDP-4-amino-4,6-dideoxy-N-acetyl-beta-L-altrosamine transaminase